MKRRRGSELELVMAPTASTSCGSCRLYCMWMVASLLSAVATTKFAVVAAPLSTTRPFAIPRGGALLPSSNSCDEEDSRQNESSTTSETNLDSNATVEEYIAAMKEKDAESSVNENSVDTSPEASTASPTPDSKVKDSNNAEKPNVVGVKKQKKSNAVGDPDGDDDDDDDDSSSDMMSDLSEWEEELLDIDRIEPEVQMQVELVEETPSLESEGESWEDDDDDSDKNIRQGGVGVRLARMRKRSKNSNGKRGKQVSDGTKSLSKDQSIALMEAWIPHVYFPPTHSGLEHLSKNARVLDSASKIRLDRHTLYAGLLLEWGAGVAKSSQNQRRQFLRPSTSQSLQGALSMATQPKWRNSSPRTSGIRLYEDKWSAPTLAMQETIAASLAHSMGCGFLILDDNILNTVRHDLVTKGGVPVNELSKPAALLGALLEMAKQGRLRPTSASASITTCMMDDINLGLEDPHDERAKESCDDMASWEEMSRDYLSVKGMPDREQPVPLVIFVRTEASSLLLKSKSAMELLIHECTSKDGVHLLTLGQGIDSNTADFPDDVFEDSLGPQNPNNFPSVMGQNPNDMSRSHPWFGFSEQNQNASGQNDPEGSQRFNIFLSRTMNKGGQSGILGAVAPPQAGNLFPHLMAIQARERMHDAEDDPSKLDDLSDIMQNDMQNRGGSPLPPLQFFNVSLEMAGPPQPDGQPALPPPPEVIEQVIQPTMSELLNRLANAEIPELPDNSDEQSSSDPARSSHRSFSEVLRHENLRKGIAENLARAALALSDPKCQGVMLSVYVPPPNVQGKFPGQVNGRPQNNNMSGWFQKILNNHEESAATDSSADEESRKHNRQKRVRTMAAAAAVVAANNAKNSQSSDKPAESKAQRNLRKLESMCRPIRIGTPDDPVRAKSWEAWIAREKGSVFFRLNREALKAELGTRNLALEQHTGTRGAGSSLRQMMSVRDIRSDMEEIIRSAVELEASKSLRQRESSEQIHEQELGLDIDISLSQLDGDDMTLSGNLNKRSSSKEKVKPDPNQYLHPSSLEAAITMICKINPSPSGGLGVSQSTVSHRSKEEIMGLAQDKHERALISQVASPQDIGVTYDMIGGLTEVKELLRQSITYPLKFPHLYSEGIAREAVKGVLLFGPPGTGKTMLAKAVATEGGASFLSVDASSVENKWLGESEKNAKAVFTLARRLAPCVIFVDEVDSLLSSREGSSDDSAHGTLTSVKTTMMSEWDGLNSGTNGSGDRVVVIGSTNRPFDLDEAVLRRFPRRILVDLPDLSTRQEILEVTLAENRLDPTVNLTEIAERLDGYTGSDIKEVCREAVVQISHEQARLLDQGFTHSRGDGTEGSLQRLRPVTSDDFESALSKLKRSVSEKGKELARVWEWNDEYGEIKKEQRNHLPQLMNMYL